MKKNLFTIFFTIIITSVFISLLAYINEISKEQIQKNLEIEKNKSILYAFNIFPKNFSENQLKSTSNTSEIPWETEQLFETMKKSFIKVSLQELGQDLYIRFDGENIVSIGFYIEGKGLWGTMDAFIAISKDLNSLIGLDFTKQDETPGLGARITEQWFKKNFRNLDISYFTQPDNSRTVKMVREMKQPNTDNQTNQFEAITGATLTSRGVLEMLNIDLSEKIKIIQNNFDKIQEQIKEISS